MSRLLAACAVLALALPAPADDKPKPNTLTPKEVADGWLLLLDGETTFGWKIDGPSKVSGGVLHLGGGPKGTTARLAAPFANFDAVVEIDGSEGAVETVLGEARSARFNRPAVVEVSVRAPEGGAGDSNRLTAFPVGPDNRGRERVDIVSRGRTVFGFNTAAGGVLRVRSVKLRPLGANPLFTGKDLSGWKVNPADPKRVASKFEVTKAGELSVKDGPGDLVTDKEFDNFVLQLECKTLGDGLNSGVFFRCVPGQYQNGYEAQIQNAFLDKDRTKPKDFGTGAIYRRVPARKVVSNDNEWFTMTVVADGRHISTWVNGYQTVDWTDDRKENENPRQGYRAAKGPISIQGHDPTTDLLFRNIRIAELGGEKRN